MNSECFPDPILLPKWCLLLFEIFYLKLALCWLAFHTISFGTLKHRGIETHFLSVAGTLIVST